MISSNDNTMKINKTIELVQVTDLRTRKLIQDDKNEKHVLLRRINSYESSLNCNMSCCLKQIKELNSIGINQSESGKIESINPASSHHQADNMNAKFSSLSMELLPNRKRSKAAIQCEPYLNDAFSYTNAQLVRITNSKRKESIKSMKSVSQATTASISEREPIYFGPLKHSTSNSSSLGYFSSKSSSKFSSSSNSVVNFEEMKNSKNASVKSWVSMLTVIKNNDQNSVSSVDSVRNPQTLCELAKSCYRNYIRRNAICNPYHIPLKRDIYLNQEIKNESMDKIFGFIKLKNNRTEKELPLIN